MKYQKGFVAIVLLVIVGLAAIGGGYAYYKHIQQEKSIGVVETIPQPQAVAESQPVSQAITPIATSSSTAVSVEVALSCNGNADCLIAAAKECTSANGVVSFANIELPFMQGLLASGKTKYELKKNAATCTVNYTPISASVSLSAEARSKMIAQGMASAEIDTELKSMNESFGMVNNKMISCSGPAVAITSFLADQLKGNGNLSFDATSDGVSSKTIITTSSGQKVSCTQ